MWNWKKLLYIILFIKQKQTHRHREQMYGHPEGEGAGMNREMGTDVYTLFVHVCVKLLTHVRLFVTP